MALLLGFRLVYSQLENWKLKRKLSDIVKTWYLSLTLSPFLSVTSVGLAEAAGGGWAASETATALFLLTMLYASS